MQDIINVIGSVLRLLEPVQLTCGANNAQREV